MNYLEESIAIVLQQLKSGLAATTWKNRCGHFNQLKRLACSLGINKPCQKLYDVFVEKGNESKKQKTIRIHCIKLLDRITGSNAKDKNGKFYNEKLMPNKEETQKYFSNLQFPLLDKVSIDHLIVKAEIEMEYLNHTKSTIGQYRHSWMDIRQYFYKNDFITYDKELLQHYIQEIGILRKNGSMKEWKWKINRKAAYTLMEVAGTGTFHWGLIMPGLRSVNLEIETIRNHYLSSLKQRNLSKSTLYLHDYVFRKLFIFLCLEKQEELFLLSPKSVQSVIIKFASICNKRSMATILPILRLILKSLHTSRFIDKDLSGIVMSNFIQKGSVASYLSQESKAILLQRINHESKRTKAIILLALKLGLRDSDICNLTFQEFDWHNDKVRLIQKKTGEPLVLPLLPEIGNAVMDYILHERPKRDDEYPYIFLRKQAPFNKITTAYHFCSKLLRKLEIKPENNEVYGVHVFRYTLVHDLLAAKIPHQIITDILGHVSKESDKPYLSMEESMLRMCALDFAIIGKISWERGI